VTSSTPARRAAVAVAAAATAVLLTACGTEPAPWFLPAGFTLDPAATRVEVLVDEQGCTSGEGAAGNTAEPVVELTATEVRIAVTTFARRGAQACPGHPLAPVAVDLGEAIGARTLVDVHGAVDDDLAPRGDVVVPPLAPAPAR
jgi:hypothetical protein